MTNRILRKKSDLLFRTDDNAFVLWSTGETQFSDEAPKWKLWAQKGNNFFPWQDWQSAKDTCSSIGLKIEE